MNPTPLWPISGARRRMAIVAFVLKYKHDHQGVSPSVREIGKAVGVEFSLQRPRSADSPREGRCDLDADWDAPDDSSQLGGIVTSTVRRFSPYIAVSGEGTRFGLMTCLRCGAVVMIEPEFDRPGLHDAWHDFLSANLDLPDLSEESDAHGGEA